MTEHATPQTFRQVFKSGEFRRMQRYDRAVLRAAMMGVRVIRARVPIDQGGLRRETKERVYGRAQGASGTLVEIVENQPYAAEVEYGSKPHWVPFEVLYAWATRQAPNLGLDGDQVIYGFARAVQLKIAREGTKAQWPTRDSLPELRRILGAELVKAARARSDTVLERVA